jgi:[acyl-carrier-protein] S-malonyltransferase
MRVGLLFPGQGSQKVGMGLDLYETYPAARAVFDLADDTLGFRLSRFCFEGPEAELTDTANAQPAILVTSLALHAALGEHAPVSDCVAGHSLGEYTALVVAGSLAARDAVRLTRQRGEWMKKAGEKAPGGMAAILNIDDEPIEAACRQAREETGGVVQIANYNSPGQIVVSGDVNTLNRAMELVKERGARRVIPLSVSVATHSPLMAYASDGLQQAINAVTFSVPSMPVIGNVSGEALTSVGQIEQELMAQLTAPVRWTKSINEMLARGVDHFVEVGPGAVLTGLVRRVNKDVKVTNVSDVATLRTFVEGA